MMKTIHTDILVVGAGCAGINAAVAAGRCGKHVLLVEKMGCLGGTSTLVLDTMNGFYIPGKDNLKVVSGIGDEILERLNKRNECFERPNTYGSGTVITYNPEMLKRIYSELLEEAHVDVLFHAIASNVKMEDGHIKVVELVSKTTTILVHADVVIDCSGDGDIAYLCDYEFDGVGGSEHVQALTTTFRVANIDEEKAKTFTKQEMWNWMKEANESGEYNLPRIEGSFHKTTIPGCVATNMVRVILDNPTDIFALSKAELQGQEQVHEYYRFMKTYLPGYKHCELLSSSIQIGVRETRRIIGEYVLCKEDVVHAHKFKDGIVLCGSPIEDHNKSTKTKWIYLKENDVFMIPYRCLIPKGSKNLIVAGRCLSASHDAHAASRSIAQCMGMGQAAGIGAVLAIDKTCSVTDIDVDTLRIELMKQGVQLEVGDKHV